MMAKYGFNWKKALQRDLYNLVWHYDARKFTFEYVGGKKRISQKLHFHHLLSHKNLLTSIATNGTF